MNEHRYLLDSNICIYILDGTAPVLRQRLEACRQGEVAVSAIAYAEVMRGIALDDIDRERRANDLFAVFEVLPFDRGSAEIYRRLPFRRASFDRLIAAHALAHDLTLITNNERDFADLPKLRVENWTR